MPIDDVRTAPLFHFTCPECGFGDGEWGHLATFEDSHCMVCHMDDGRAVRLRRWSASPEPDVPATPR